VPLPSFLLDIISEQSKKVASGRSRVDKAASCSSVVDSKTGNSKIIIRMCKAPDYNQLIKSIEQGFCTRAFAKQLIGGYVLDLLDDVRVVNWIKLVNTPTLVWDVIESIEKVERPDVTYDFSVAGKEAFCIDGVFLTHNTMNYHVPVSDDAVKEAIEKMLPSKNLLSASDFDTMYTPPMEYLHGLYLASRGKMANKPVKYFATQADVVAAFKRGEINIDDPVQIVGKH
jgi:DNA-directed RNA polymerase beta' subunit